ncbi:hypothetical protein ABK040_007376 [Willaertia magna]
MTSDTTIQSSTTTSKINTSEIAEHFHGELPFTLSQLKKAIPSHCFNRSLLTSSLHVTLDAIQALLAMILFSRATNWITENFGGNMILEWSLYSVIALLYIIFQSVTFTGLWVLQHECGHHAFCENDLISDIYGFIIGTMLYVPYFAWQKSHGLHHANTNRMERDQVWVPQTVISDEKEIKEKNIAIKGNSFTVMIDLIVITTIGWPLHLLLNVSGPMKENFVAYCIKGKRYEPYTENDTSKDKCQNNENDNSKGFKFTSHYYPYSPIFSKSEVFKIYLSVLGLIIWSFILYNFFIQTYGFLTVFIYYFIPLMGNFFFLTSITFLQHVDERIPHFDDNEWNWLKGAISTIDRAMHDSLLGRILDSKLHHIHDTHVCHHIFSKIPFYHAQEATIYLKKMLSGEYAKKNGDEAILVVNNNNNNNNKEGSDNEKVFNYYNCVEAKQESFFTSLVKELRDCLVLKRDKKYPGILFWLKK